MAFLFECPSKTTTSSLYMFYSIERQDQTKPCCRHRFKVLFVLSDCDMFLFVRADGVHPKPSSQRIAYWLFDILVRICPVLSISAESWMWSMPGSTVIRWSCTGRLRIDCFSISRWSINEYYYRVLYFFGQATCYVYYWTIIYWARNEYYWWTFSWYVTKYWQVWIGHSLTTYPSPISKPY